MGDENEAAARELQDHYSLDELKDMLKKLFVWVMRRLGRGGDEADREYSELMAEVRDKEGTARAIIWLRAQYQDTFDDDPKSRF